MDACQDNFVIMLSMGNVGPFGFKIYQVSSMLLMLIFMQLYTIWIYLKAKKIILQSKVENSSPKEYTLWFKGLPRNTTEQEIRTAINKWYSKIYFYNVSEMEEQIQIKDIISKINLVYKHSKLKQYDIDLLKKIEESKLQCKSKKQSIKYKLSLQRDIQQTLLSKNSPIQCFVSLKTSIIKTEVQRWMDRSKTQRIIGFIFRMSILRGFKLKKTT